MSSKRYAFAAVVALAGGLLGGCQVSRHMVGDPIPAFVQLSQDVPAPSTGIRVTGVLKEEGDCLTLGGPTVIVVWPKSAPAARVDCCGNTIIVWPIAASARREGGGSTVIFWPRTTARNPAMRMGERVELTGSLVENAASLPLAGQPGARCGRRAFVVSEARVVR